MSRRGMPFEVVLGLRYLRARGQRANLSLFVWIGVGGVFLGVSALIVVLAVMTGFQDGIRDKIIAANPHILIMESGGRGVADAGVLAAGVTPIAGLRSATPFVLQQALFTVRGGGATGGLLRGVDLDSPTVRAALGAAIKLGRLDPLLRTDGEPALLLGRELARSLGAVPGDHVTLISPQGAMTAVGLVPKMRRFEVAGFVEVGMYEYDSSLAFTGLARRPGVRRARGPRERDRGEARRPIPRERGDAAARRQHSALATFTPIWKPHGPSHRRWPLQRNSTCQATAKTFITTRYQMIPYIYSYARIAQGNLGSHGSADVPRGSEERDRVAEGASVHVGT